jgi:hypothetical protein
MGLIDRSIDCSVKRCRPAWSIRMIRRCLKHSGAPLTLGAGFDGVDGEFVKDAKDACGNSVGYSHEMTQALRGQDGGAFERQTAPDRGDLHFGHRHRNLEARNRKGGRFRLTALQNWHSN